MCWYWEPVCVLRCSRGACLGVDVEPMVIGNQNVNVICQYLESCYVELKFIVKIYLIMVLIMLLTLPSFSCMLLFQIDFLLRSFIWFT